MSDSDIREWAHKAGIDIKDAGPIPARIRNQYADATIPGDDSNGEKPPSLETPPKDVAKEKDSVFKKARAAINRAPARKTPPVRARRPRVGIDRVVQRIWGLLADMAKPINVPVARVLAMQS